MRIVMRYALAMYCNVRKRQPRRKLYKKYYFLIIDHRNCSGFTGLFPMHMEYKSLFWK